MAQNRTFQRDVDIAVDRIARILRHKVMLISDKDFVTHIERMEIHFQNYEEVWLTGHFSNAFNKRVRGLKGKYGGVDFRILAIDPGRNAGNIRALKELKELGAEVKIHPNLHARMFIGCNETTDTMCLILGSYDYNREGLSGEKENLGITTSSPELIKQAKEFFINLWESPLAQDIDGLYL